MPSLAGALLGNGASSTEAELDKLEARLEGLRAPFSKFRADFEDELKALKNKPQQEAQIVKVGGDPEELAKAKQREEALQEQLKDLRKAMLERDAQLAAAAAEKEKALEDLAAARREIEEKDATIDQLQDKLDRAREKIKELKREIKQLKIRLGEATEDDATDDEGESDDELPDFLVPYAKRISIQGGKPIPRWLMLSRDARCFRLKRDFVVDQKRRSTQQEILRIAASRSPSPESIMGSPPPAQRSPPGSRSPRPPASWPQSPAPTAPGVYGSPGQGKVPFGGQPPAATFE